MNCGPCVGAGASTLKLASHEWNIPLYYHHSHPHDREVALIYMGVGQPSYFRLSESASKVLSYNAEAVLIHL